MKLVLIGDGQSPHLLKWARALAPEVELWAASSRGFLPGFDALLPASRRFAMNSQPNHGGGNLAMLKHLPALGAWLAKVDADWLHAHYLTSHGSLAWAAKRLWRLRARIIGSAWGSDILVTPDRNGFYLQLTRWVLRSCTICTSDSRHMTARMQLLGAAEVLTFPLGLEALPEQIGIKQPWRFFANRGLEPIYRPERVIEAFAAVAAKQPQAQLIVANEGSLLAALQDQVRVLGLAGRVSFVGRLDADRQAEQYQLACWYLSLPASDSVAVSVLEAMAHGCVPLLSDLPANHELLSEPGRGLIVEPGDIHQLPARLEAFDVKAAAAANRDWVAAHGLFAPAVKRFLARLKELD